MLSDCRVLFKAVLQATAYTQTGCCCYIEYEPALALRAHQLQAELRAPSTPSRQPGEHCQALQALMILLLRGHDDKPKA